MFSDKFWHHPLNLVFQVSRCCWAHHWVLSFWECTKLLSSKVCDISNRFILVLPNDASSLALIFSWLHFDSSSQTVPKSQSNTWNQPQAVNFFIYLFNFFVLKQKEATLGHETCCQINHPIVCINWLCFFNGALCIFRKGNRMKAQKTTFVYYLFYNFPYITHLSVFVCVQAQHIEVG